MEALRRRPCPSRQPGPVRSCSSRRRPGTDHRLRHVVHGAGLARCESGGRVSSHRANDPRPGHRAGQSGGRVPPSARAAGDTIDRDRSAVLPQPPAGRPLRHRVRGPTHAQERDSWSPGARRHHPRRRSSAGGGRGRRRPPSRPAGQPGRRLLPVVVGRLDGPAPIGRGAAHVGSAGNVSLQPRSVAVSHPSSDARLDQRSTRRPGQPQPSPRQRVGRDGGRPASTEARSLGPTGAGPLRPHP